MQIWSTDLSVALLAMAALGAPALAQGDAPCSIGALQRNSYGSTSKLGIPYSLTAKSSFDQKLPDGNAIHGFVRIHEARSNAGLTRTETGQRCYLGDNGQPTLAYAVSVQDQQTRTSMTWQIGDMFGNNEKIVRINHFQQPKLLTPEEQAKRNAEMARQRKLDPPRAQFKYEDLGVKTLHGITVHGGRNTRTIPANAEGNELPLEVMDETWRSNELGIMMLAISDDPRRGKSTFEVEDITLAEPDPSNFTPPAGYIVKETQPQP